MHVSNRRNPRSRLKAGGFTLIEIMIVVIIISVLAAIAYASYRDMIVKSRRSAAQVCLTEAAQVATRYYTVNLKYDGVPNPPNACVSELSAFYTIGYVSAPSGNTYTLRAQPTTRQPDTECGTMTLNQAGTKTAASTSGCW